MVVSIGDMGFCRLPFTPEVGISDLFNLPMYEQTLTALRECIEDRLCAALVAPAGTGKTVLIRRLLAALPETRYRARYIKVTGLSKRDFCREICMAVDVPSRGSFPGLMRTLGEHFESVSNDHAMRPVVVVDEAHELRPDVLAMLRILTNFNLDSRLVLSLVLAGQPPLREMLRREDQVAILHRLAHLDTLRLLSRDELALYIRHRCSIAGAPKEPFDADAIALIFELSRGNMRATDRIARKAVRMACAAGDTVVTTGHITEARKYLWT